MENCIFCKIIDNVIPSYKIYEDDNVLAFLDINPAVNGHTLIIPKKHYTDLQDIDANVLANIFDVAKTLSMRITERLNCDGYTIIQNNGSPQEIKHFHIHIRPFYSLEEELLPIEEIEKVLI